MKRLVYWIQFLVAFSYVSTGFSQTGYTMPAEWESHEAVWMGLRTLETENDFDSVTIEMVRAMAPHVRLNLVLEKDTLLPEGKRWFTQFGIDTSRITLVTQAPTDYWYRDPGPVFVRNRQGQLAVVNFRYSNYGSHPDSLPDRAREHDGIDIDIAKRLKLPIITSSVFMEGGALEVNGKGTLLQVEAVTLGHNPHLSRTAIEADLKRVLGQRKVIWLKQGAADDQDGFRFFGNTTLWNYGTGGHIDEICRFTDAHTVLLTWTDEKEIGDDPVRKMNHARMKENLRILQQATDQDGKPFRIIKVPHPELPYLPHLIADTTDRFYRAELRQQYTQIKLGSTLYQVPSASYLNYMVTNGVVLLPAYWKPGLPETIRKKDEQVKATFARLFPTRKIVSINPTKFNYGGGGMHCMTQQQPAGK